MRAGDNEIPREINHSREDMLNYLHPRLETHTDKQKNVFDRVVGAIENQEPQIFFLDAPR